MDAVAAALADPVRREILLLLREQTLAAGEIAARFAITRPAISRHLRVLREAGLVVAEQEGRNRLYRLETAPLEQLEVWVAGLRATAWSQRLDALETEVYRTRRERRAAPRTKRERSA